MMWVFNKCSVLFAVIYLKTINAASSSSTEGPPSGPNWPTEYYLRGEVEDVVNADAEPFEIWYKEQLNRSRVDVYDGLVKKFYWADQKKFITIHPETRDMETIDISCAYEPRKKLPFNILPTGLHWNLIDTGLYNGVNTQTWEFKDEKYHRTAVTKKEGEFDVPIRLEKIEFSVGKGMTVGHYNTFFYEYKSTVENETLDKEVIKKDCDLPTQSIERKLQHLRPYYSHDVEIAYNRYKSHHKKTNYGNEHMMREVIFNNNWRHIISHNRKSLGYKLELNQFADWTDEELASLRGALPPKVNDPGTHPFPHTLEDIERLVIDLPEEYDLRMEGDLPPIKHQLSCGSCWAFAATATVEAALIKKIGGVQLDLSEQSLVDCAWSYGVMGCDGGFVDAAFRYVKEHGIPTEAEYGGYMHEDGICHIKNMTAIHHIKGFTQVTSHSVNALKYAVYTYGPVEVTIHASDDMLLYSHGVFYDMSCEGENLNHAVVVVGYGSRDGEPYWIVRNSWGETWGEDGYILMSAKDNNCLLLDQPYYPVV